MTNQLPPLSIGQCATLACLWEVSAPKPGNVHRGADFEDLTFEDFLTSAALIARAMEAAACGAAVGTVVLEAVRATRAAVGKNTNLGTVLLLAPLARVPRDRPLAAGVAEVLAGLAADDARDVYEAIRLAQPGGMGRAERYDLFDGPPSSLLDAMRQSAERDLVARQYVVDFAGVLEVVVPWLLEELSAGLSLSQAIIHLQMRLMARFPDSLIARKCGPALARQSAAWAESVLQSGAPGEETYHAALADFDFWLRSDRNRRNPGTTADLIAAGLFAALRDSRLPLLNGLSEPGRVGPDVRGCRS
jgi:triphosphoribosyl-dephospho-CoA synthase